MVLVQHGESYTENATIYRVSLHDRTVKKFVAKNLLQIFLRNDMVFYSADGDTKESQLSLINFEDGKTEKIIEWTDSDTFDEAWCDRGVIGRTLYTIQD